MAGAVRGVGWRGGSGRGGRESKNADGWGMLWQDCDRDGIVKEVGLAAAGLGRG